MTRHSMIRLHGTGLLAAALAAAPAFAAQWPTQPVRMIVPAAAGSPPDVIARLVAQRLGTAWGEQVVVDNRPGASGVIGMSALRQAPADGHTFILAQAAVLTVAPHINPTDRYDIDADFEPVALVAAGPMMLVAEKSAPLASVEDLIARAKSSGTPINVGVTGQYSLPHLSAEIFVRSTGLDLNIVPFASSGAAVSAVMNGDVEALFDGIPGVDAMLRSGRLKALGVASEQPLPSAPGLPLLTKAVPELNVEGWFVLAARKGTPPEVVERVNRDVNTVVADAALVEQMGTLGVWPRPLSQAETARFVDGERKRWTAVLAGMDIQKPR